MYGALWKVLPGPWWVRTIILIAALAVAVYVLAEFVFPWADDTFFSTEAPSIG